MFPAARGVGYVASFYDIPMFSHGATDPALTDKKVKSCKNIIDYNSLLDYNLLIYCHWKLLVKQYLYSHFRFFQHLLELVQRLVKWEP